MNSVKLPVTDTDSDHEINQAPIKKEIRKSTENFHANLMNKGSDDSAQQKSMRMAAMKRRASKVL